MTETPQQAHKADEQPMACPRCGGLMVLASYMDLRDDQGQIEFTAYRCTICGEVIDPVILRNRIAERPNLLHGTKQRRFGQAITASPPPAERDQTDAARDEGDPNRRHEDRQGREA